MANTLVQLRVAEWVRDVPLQEIYGCDFLRRKVPLSSGGLHEFAAVNSDESIIGAITTGRAFTKSQKMALGKLDKVRADLYFLHLTSAKQLFIVATDPDMALLLERERDEFGRIPCTVDIIAVRLPADLQKELDHAQSAATAEVSVETG